MWRWLALQQGFTGCAKVFGGRGAGAGSGRSLPKFVAQSADLAGKSLDGKIAARSFARATGRNVNLKRGKAAFKSGHLFSEVGWKKRTP